MGWLMRKLDTLGGAVFAGVAGAAVSQFQAFVQQYVQRLGGHLDEAQRVYETIQNSERYRALAAEARDVLLTDAHARVEEIRAALDALDRAGLFAKPFVFIAHFDPGIASRTLESFSPALPVDMASLVYAGMGLIAGLVLWGIVKAPFALIFRRRRKERKAGTP